jgi:signal transduction histidine kinase
MAQDTNLSHDPRPIESLEPASSLIPSRPLKQGIRTHILLVMVMAAVMAIVTSLFFVLLQHRLRSQVTGDLSEDLHHSVVTFENLQSERLAALDRENALLSELPTLKALMTSGDDRTIQDGAVEFWQLSGDDLFALADSSGRVIALYTKNGTPSPRLAPALRSLISSDDKHFLVNGSALYACSWRPLYFGTDEGGTLLGYVISGVSIERTVRQISEPTGVEATFLSNESVVASTLPPAMQAGLANPLFVSATTTHPLRMTLGHDHFLAATEDFSSSATSPLRLVLLKSFGPAEARIEKIERLILSTGLLVLLFGTVLMIVIARLLTRPLEELSSSVRAFGMGDSRHDIPAHGPQEVRQLSAAFASMREEIQEKSRALLESERLATIGRMASSVSHDLRHYLAAVYANSEFLASGRLSDEERQEIFADIRTAVHGTTDMIESLLIFSRTGSSTRKAPELISNVADRVLTMLRAHPDAEGVKLTANWGEPANTSAMADRKQVERAIYNLLLNACQAAKAGAREPAVAVTLESTDASVTVRVTDNGAGVSESIRDNLFEPFVSEGRQKGTGLGLTMAARIAEEHGGQVTLVSSRPGETVFELNIARGDLSACDKALPDTPRVDEVDTHEKAWT